MRFEILLGLCLTFSASAQDPSNRFFTTFNGRFHCNGQWTDFQFTAHPGTDLLGVTDPSEPVTVALQFYFRRSLTQMDGASYVMRGPFDAKTGHFRLEPQRWSSRTHPDSFEMIGMEGTFDAATRKINAKMLSGKCDAVEIAAPGEKLAPLEAGASALTAAKLPDSKGRPELKTVASNVTNTFELTASTPAFEYWVASWSEPPGVVHQGTPIDEAVAQMLKDKYACSESERVTWEPGGMKGSAPGRVTVTERYVIECLGNCKDVWYQPNIGGFITHSGLTMPLPTLQIKGITFGGSSFRWFFLRKSNTQPPPQIYIHRWEPLTGKGPFDGSPEYIKQRQAEAPSCRAPAARR